MSLKQSQLPRCARGGNPANTGRFPREPRSVRLRIRQAAPGSRSPGEACLPGSVSGILGTVELPAELLSRYEVVRRLGEGGMGIVYHGRHLELGMPVAIKVLTQEAGLEPDLRNRFLAEGRLAARVRHPNVVGVMESGVTAGGLPYVVYEFLEGADLSALLAGRGRLPPDEAVGVMRSVLEGLAAIHEAGIVHRDLKPANIVITARGDVKILDFGIARNLLDARVRTRTGIVLGTPHYLSPEAIAGGKVGPPADIYSAGILLYELLSGRPPFEGSALAEILEQHLKAQPPRVGVVVPSVAESVESAVFRAMAKAPVDRFPSAGEFRIALGETEGGRTDAPETGRLTAAGSKRPSGRSTARTMARGVSRPISRSTAVIAPAARALWPMGVGLFLAAGIALVGVYRFGAPQTPPGPGSRASDAAVLLDRKHPGALVDGQTPRPEVGRVVRAQLGHLVTLPEQERHGDEPSRVSKRLQYLKGALDALDDICANRPTPEMGRLAPERACAQGELVTAWAVAALLADEARFAGSSSATSARAKPLLDHAERCRQRLTGRVEEALAAMKHDAGMGGGRATSGAGSGPQRALEDLPGLRELAKASRVAAPAATLLWVAAVANDQRATSRVGDESAVEVLGLLRDGSAQIASSKAGQDVAMAVSKRYRQLSTGVLESSGTRSWGDWGGGPANSGGSRGGRDLMNSWILGEQERVLLKGVVLKLDPTVDPLMPLVGMCFADQAQRWIRRGKLSATSKKSIPVSQQGRGLRASSSRLLGMRWIDLSWFLKSVIDEDRLDRVRRESSAAEIPMMPGASTAAEYFSSRVDVLPATQVLMDDRIRETRKMWGGF